MKFFRLVFRLLSIFLAILATVQGDGNPNSTEYCTNEKCRLAADELLHSQNRSVNPCDDFFAHACTGPRGSHLYRIHVQTQNEITQLLKNVKPGDMEALNKAKKFQDACNQRDAIKARGLRPIETILSEKGEWPVTVPSEERNDQYRSWQEIHEHFVKSTSIAAVFDVTVEADRRNPGVHILSLGVPTMPYKKVHFIARTKRQTRSSQYREYLLGVVNELKQLSGLNVKYDDLLADPEGVIGFEDEIVKLAINLDKDFNNEIGDDLRMTTVETLQHDWDAVVPRTSNYSINWLKVINDRFEGTGIVIDASEKIALKPAVFVANFSRLLMNTPVRTIVNYINWKVIDNLVGSAHSEFFSPHERPKIISQYTGTFCVDHHKMIHAVAYIYVKSHLGVRSKTDALEMIQNIKDGIKREVDDSSWLDEATKSAIRNKIDAMKSFVDYPEWYDEPGKIDEYYREFTVGDDHFENVLAYNKFATKKQLSKLRSLVDETETDWIAMPYSANAEYLQQPNAISIPAAILQSPFFVHERPSVLNYASLGAVIGHEISHGFDNLGRLWDGAGIKRKWWSQSAIDTFKTKAQCFVEQYNKYTVDLEKVILGKRLSPTKRIFAVTTVKETVHINGTETQAENIADTMGFRSSLRAYQKLRNDGKTNNVKIQQLGNLTDEQLYFYQLTYALCEQGAIESMETGTLEAHTDVRTRIIGPLSNMQEFADAFHCPPGSPMNPLTKCLIWD